MTTTARATEDGPPAAVTARDVNRWVMARVEQYLLAAGQPRRRRVGDLAVAVGVSRVTLCRWRKGETNVATHHLDRLLAALGLTRDDLARGLGLESADQIPAVRLRGPGSPNAHNSHDAGGCQSCGAVARGMRYVRGCCWRCYERHARHVRCGQTTWADLLAQGKIRATPPPTPPPGWNARNDDASS